MFFVLFCFSLLAFMLHVSDHISSHTVMVRWHLYIYILHPITSFLQPEHWWKWLKSVSSFTFFFIIIISKSVSGESQPSLPFRVYWSFRACATENTVWASVQVIHDVWKSGSSKHFSSNVLEALRAVLTHTGSVLRWVSYPSSRYPDQMSDWFEGDQIPRSRQRKTEQVGCLKIVVRWLKHQDWGSCVKSFEGFRPLSMLDKTVSKWLTCPKKFKSMSSKDL